MIIAGSEMGVGADRPAFATHDHRNLGVGLPLYETVDHLHPGPLEPARPEKILLLVEARLQLDHCGDRFARFRRRHQRIDDRRLLSGAIQRLLDRHDIGIVRRLVEVGDHCVEAFVRVMDDEVLGADGGKDVAIMLQDALGEPRGVGWKLERRQVGLDQLRQVRDADQPAAFGDQRRPGPRAFAHQRFDIGRGVVVEFDPDHAPPPPPLDRRSEVAHQILGLVVDLDVTVAKNPESAVGDLGEAGKKLVEVGDDRGFDGDESDRRAFAWKRDEARQGRRDHQQFGQLLALAAAGQAEHQTEAAVGNEREGMRRVDRLRGQHRQNLLAKVIRQPTRLLDAEPVGGDHLKPAFGQCFAQQDPLGLLGDHQGVGLGSDRVQLLGRRAAVDRQILDPAQLLTLQTSHAGNEKFVDVGTGNGEKTEAL